LQHQESSAFLWGWASETGEPSGALPALVGGFDPARGWGSSNRLRYDNPTLDAVLTQALTTMDPSAQAALFQEATKLAINDGGILPLVFLNASWALRGNLAFYHWFS
jgi:peptide/nickel transport system substrate-binding protein